MDGSRLTKGLSEEISDTVPHSNHMCECSLAALESMRGGARMRPDGAWPSERLLNDTLPKVGARCSLGGDVGEKERAGLGGVGGPRSSEVVAAFLLPLGHCITTLEAYLACSMERTHGPPVAICRCQRRTMST